MLANGYSYEFQVDGKTWPSVAAYLKHNIKSNTTSDEANAMRMKALHAKFTTRGSSAGPTPGDVLAMTYPAKLIHINMSNDSIAKDREGLGARLMERTTMEQSHMLQELCLMFMFVGCTTIIVLQSL
ncbi:hypothetical protein HDU86_007564 [Geranomyces michiganensis]|nr:hypothetical protein HDU86_007564 [Geranomyces michiganensis]